jgi:hypothetical protein
MVYMCRCWMFGVGVLCLLFCSSLAVAHVPYFEHYNFSEQTPFLSRKMVTQSKAIYAWLEHDGVNPCVDIDVYKIAVRRPLSVYVELLVPVVDEYYMDFVPWFAFVGPGLADPGYDLPFDLPVGYGAVVNENVKPGDDRETFYEPFGGKSYYKGPVHEGFLNQTGIYYVYVWDPYESGGDYTVVLGSLEIWGPLDILRALVYTPCIRKGLELHII